MRSSLRWLAPGAMVFCGLALSGSAVAQKVPDARALGVPLTGTPGPVDAITDVMVESALCD